MQQLRRALTDGFTLLHVEAMDLDAVFAQVTARVAHQGLLSAADAERVREKLSEREAQLSTAIGHAVAVPHAYLDVMTAPVIVFVRLAHPLNLGAPDGIPTRFLFVLLGPSGVAEAHLDTLTAIARLTSDDEFRYDVGEADSEADLLAALDRFQVRTAPPVVPGQGPVPDGLRPTGRLFGGLLADLKRRLPHYRDDFRDGLHPKCLAATVFLFFACLAPTVAFGGVMAELTDGRIGTVEMIASVAFGGVVYALLSGQPMVILGGTGPLLVFTATLFDLCRRMGLQEHFLSVYALVGLWTALFTLILVATDAGALMRYFSRFTVEIFAALIAAIYITEALRSLGEVFFSVYAEKTTSHDRALIPLLLATGTYLIAGNLSRFRRSRYLLPWMREFLADFGPTIAIAAMTLAAVGLHSLAQVDLQELSAPDTFEPTLSVAGRPRPWLVDPFAAPPWTWFAAAVPALLGTVLLFLDQNITCRLVNDADHRLRRGEAYHWDLAVVGCLVGVCSMFGLPWLVAATVRSLNHLRAVATTEERVTRGGDVRDHIIHVRENRLTGLCIHLLIGASILLLPVIKTIPLSVLFGLFLYMGVVSLRGNQFFERLTLWLTDPALYPRTHYIRRVPRGTVHAFTLLQLGCLVALWALKVSPWGIAFPLALALLVPLRLWLGKVFAPRHLAALDAESEPDEEETHWL